MLRPFLIAAAFLSALFAANTSWADPSHAIAMHGTPALPADFQHLPYANPDAPKGGRINYGWQGTFDSLNPFIVQGDSARGLFDIDLGNTVFDTLMARSRDEPFSLYPLLAQSVETDEDRTFVEFTLDPRAKFSDGQAVTPDDVIFSFELLRDKARPLYKRWIEAIARMEKVGAHGLRLTFNDKADRETPLLLAQLPILPRHATNAETFDRSTLKPLIGSGPYTVESVRPGESVTLRRNLDYWAKDIPSKRGFDNFDEIRVNYFRDENTLFEALKKGDVDVFTDLDTGRWATGYDFPAVRDGRLIQDRFAKKLPSGMFGFVLNTRRPVFKDRAVREAVSGLFDFEWANQNLYSNAYQRTKSFYDGSELSSSGRPADEAERKLLAAFPDSVLPSIMDGTWQPPVSDGTGRDRTFMKKGFDALKAAGYTLKDGRMIGPDGRQFAFEILINGKSGESVAVAWQRTLERLGIAVTLRSVDSAQYLQRQRTYDFDAMLTTYTSSLSPGVEQRFRWGSQSRDADGTYNFAGVADPAIDAMIDKLLAARSREDFVTAVRAYDRMLLSGFYVVPLYFQPEQRVARWAYIKHPEAVSLYGATFPTMWRDPR